VEGAIANISRHLTASYELPNISRYGRTLDAEIGARQEETDAYDLSGPENRCDPVPAVQQEFHDLGRRLCRCDPARSNTS
jgi:hypothetical protein